MQETVHIDFQISLSGAPTSTFFIKFPKNCVEIKVMWRVVGEREAPTFPPNCPKSANVPRLVEYDGQLQ